MGDDLTHLRWYGTKDTHAMVFEQPHKRIIAKASKNFQSDKSQGTRRTLMLCIVNVSHVVVRGVWHQNGELWARKKGLEQQGHEQAYFSRTSTPESAGKTREA